ncbi:Cupredoxin [bacterium]|nr:MAG: Cupredoxin [bacterium]
MLRRSLPLSLVMVALLALAAGELPANAAPAPIYVHMNGTNDFLESVVAVRPGQPVVFVNEDTDPHTIVGFDALTGKQPLAINGRAAGTPGAAHGVGTFTVTLARAGIYSYYCSLHARLSKTYGGAVQAAPRKGVDGYGGAMAGVIIVTSDPSLLSRNPKTTVRRVLPDFFSGG